MISSVVCIKVYISYWDEEIHVISPYKDICNAFPIRTFYSLILQVWKKFAFL